MNRKRSIFWERLKYGLCLLPHFYSSRGTVMRLRFYHNVNYWCGCPKKCMSGGSQVVSTALKAAAGVLCGVEFSRNFGWKCGCDRKDLWLKVSHPSDTHGHSLDQARCCRKKKESFPPGSYLPQCYTLAIWEIYLFYLLLQVCRILKAIHVLPSYLLLSYFPSPQALALR